MSAPNVYGVAVQTPTSAVPASISSGGTYVTGPFVVGGGYIAVTAKLAAAGTLAVQRYADSGLTQPVGAVVSAALSSGTGGSVVIADGAPALYGQATVSAATSGALDGVTILTR